jgi:diguanylate cyclase (GGDEF)-like protein
MYRAGRRRSAALFGGYLVLQLATIIWGAVADTGRLGGVYLAGFAFLALALLITTGMGLDLRDRNRDLARTAEELSEEIRWREEAELNIRQLAYQDHLSGLPNRAQLMDHLELALDEARETGRGGAMMLIDLDHFKTINAGLSHDVGDEVLREVARRVRRAAGEDGFVARLGGDEFVVVIGDLPPEHEAAEARARDLAEAALARLVGPLQLGARVLDVGASAGIVRFPDDAATVGDVLRRADMAVAHAKALGRNNVQFYLPALQAAADARLELERGLRVALVEGHLYLRFQPQVSASGAVIGAEVLLRWRHPELGEIGPDRFIPVAEETGLIHEVGDWVLETACERLAAWSAAESPFTGHLAVNVSGWQLIRPGYVERVERTLERFRLPPSRLTLEVTESTFLYHMEEAAAQLAALREFGIRISLDDFGTGYSSLAYLQNLPLDEIKIDRAFVRQVHPGASSPLVESIVAIGRSLRLERVAEGVELESQRRALAALGCEIFQGYLFAPPLPEEEFIAWLGAREVAPSMEA